MIAAMANITEIMKTMASTPPMMAPVSVLEAAVLVVEVLSVMVILLSMVGGVVGGGVGEHSSSLRDEIATEQSESTVVIIPFTMILTPPLSHFSIREISELLSLSEVPNTLARYVTDVGELS